jgi:hypothetical protein
MTGMWFSMSTLKFKSNKYTALYFREDKSKRRICAIFIRENVTHLVTTFLKRCLKLNTYFIVTF